MLKPPPAPPESKKDTPGARVPISADVKKWTLLMLGALLVIITITRIAALMRHDQDQERHDTCAAVSAYKTLRCSVGTSCSYWFGSEPDAALPGYNACSFPKEMVRSEYRINKRGLGEYRLCAETGRVDVAYRAIKGDCPLTLPE
ncbi:hypothetical protein A3G63_03155 [Candidatus Kaiserbacteria bacterium RIFCSPLOWO2_12_FULL_52_8]|uniref:Uncharacterized protein n=1 Tax=Candidatus Kaiserbacteria bacterium RIFCSPHIGHO2_01_FULL_53_31 TaxID=1798481 RepID=A0A1F6CI34_9BACT|nr:MAG: hypothetical protein A2678_03385 [Candidatus Kaiserbacteria bacterium RIFCSPHIGHO2_01_FULL_53_31]OGG92705.1 MAG: hypothetical protein A3G63_03155 [Candidatus Kaiserbacteria bacterium RIFCSPLOWO2_12_FULL_52_8]